jgi:hypothetical protein
MTNFTQLDTAQPVISQADQTIRASLNQPMTELAY